MTQGIKRILLYSFCALALGTSNQSNADRDDFVALVGVMVVGGIGYKVYKAFQPTPEALAKLKLEQERIALEGIKIAQEMAALKAEEEFKKCLNENVYVTPYPKGSVPLACKELALALALAVGNEKVTNMIAAFHAYKNEPLYSRDA